MNHAVALIIETPDGIPLVSDPKKPIPRYWKFPGGRGEPGESPNETASRELLEETGIQIEAAALELLYSEDRRDHSFFLFHARLDKPIQLLSEGSEKERVKLFAYKDIISMADFFPRHLALAKKFLR